MSGFREGGAVSEAIRQFTIWKLAIFKMVVGFLIVVGLPILSSNFDWHTSTAWVKIQFMVGLLLAGLKYLDGFLDTTIQNIKSKRNALGLDLDPQVTSQTTTSETTPTLQTTTSTVVRTDDKTSTQT